MSDLNLGLVGYDNGDDQKHYHKSCGSHQEKNVAKIVMGPVIRPSAQIQTQSEELLSWKEDKVVMNKKDNCDSDATVLYDPEENNLVIFFSPVCVRFYSLNNIM